MAQGDSWGMWEMVRKTIGSSFVNNGRGLKAWAAFPSYFLSAGFQNVCSPWNPGRPRQEDEREPPAYILPPYLSPQVPSLDSPVCMAKPCPPTKPVCYREDKLRANAYEIPGMGSGPSGQGTLGSQEPKCGLEGRAQALGIPLALKIPCPWGIARPYKESVWRPSKVGIPEKEPWLHEAMDSTDFQILK